ncbi:MAG: hypothetical protein PHS32_07890 [Rhodoferax sp.]|uniref:hypothetical protein n=1 Tax=Rhodoferax sp. TaxID=50421 RepID=UPI00261C8308|nr:hypothetical protein [Rhodoferax sp.]MDD5333641.1 hypothetical protein [Rhodoferax sp.]MDD5333651.1 hypothetical protein [Rhodoferax sp.]
MKTIPLFEFWGLVVLAGIGLIRAAWDIWGPKEKQEAKRLANWATPQQRPTPPGEAPKGFTWILVKTEDLQPKE